MLQAQILQGRYQLQEKLGQNAGRQTWLAVDLVDPAPIPVILKLLAFSPQMQWDDFKLFEREAQVLKNLNHPRIPRYRNSFSLDKQIGDGLCWFGLVQDYIPGHSLQQLLNQGKRFTEAQIRSFVADILNILIYLHELSPPVLHRDIKPSNLILGEDEQIYLVDFGAVQNQAAAEGVTFTIVGTSGYTPLEQFWGRAVPASDLYALGATLIHLLTGTAPAELPQKHLRIQFSDKVILHHTFIRWIEVLTEPDLDQRFSGARHALLALQGCCQLKSSTSNLPQPLDGRVQIKKSTNQISVKLPLRGASQQHIYFDSNCFVIEKQLFGWSYLRQMGQTSDIKEVRKISFKKITILVGLVTYSFGEDLNEFERKWLAQEIQNWLN